MSLLDKHISYFPGTGKTECVDDKNATVGSFLEKIKNGEWESEVNKVKNGDKNAKLNLPMVAFHGIFDGFRKKKLFIESTGLIILDIDDIEEDLEEVKEDIMDGYDSVFACMISPSGNGVKVLYYVDESLVNPDTYNQIGKKIVDNFSIYGNVDYLSITDCLIVSHDPNILINEDCEPDFIMVEMPKEITGELEPLDHDRVLWEDPEDFFDTVLANDIASKTNNNYHYIQVSLMDLAKFGFTHPEHDLSFVVDYAENEFKYSSENKKRFQEASIVAGNYPQLKHPYKMIHSEEPDDEYIDYGNYQIPDDVVSGDEGQEREEKKQSFFLNVKTLFNDVIKTIKLGNRVGREISFKNFADIFRFQGVGILTLTGIPSHGKTEFSDACFVDLARLYGEETIVAGFEQQIPEHIVKLIRKMIGKDIRCPSWKIDDKLDIVQKYYDFITKHIHHIDTDVTGGNINKILEAAAEKIHERRLEGGDPKYIVIDPFNMLSIKGKFSGHEKVEEILRRLTHFSKQMKIMVVLVAHPFKMKKDEKTGQYEIPDFYSVKGSSAFFEMSYHGLVVYRRPDNSVLVKVLKVKQNNLGEKDACVYFDYDRPSGRYIPISEHSDELSGDHWDEDWLEKAVLMMHNKENNKVEE